MKNSDSYQTVRPRGVGVSTQTSARVWAEAWGRSWSGKHGRVRVREQIPMEDLRSKVSEKREHEVQENVVQVSRNAFPIWERLAFPIRERFLCPSFESDLAPP